MTIDDLLIRARKMGASDVHVTVGIPPKCRVNGELVTLMEGRILPADSKALVEQMIPGRLVERFNREGEVDFSYAIKGVGRFRVNIFKQRGTMSFVIRLVNTEIPSPESLGLPQSVLELVKKKRGLILVTGPGYPDLQQPGAPAAGHHSGGQRGAGLYGTAECHRPLSGERQGAGEDPEAVQGLLLRR